MMDSTSASSDPDRALSKASIKNCILPCVHGLYRNNTVGQTNIHYIITRFQVDFASGRADISD